MYICGITILYNEHTNQILVLFTVPQTIKHNVCVLFPASAKVMQPQSASGTKPAVRQSVFQILTCQLCREYMVPPITLCHSGHNICSSCRPHFQFSGGNKCPHCGQPLLETRNVALETIARGLLYPCRYRDAGCGMKFSMADVRKHHGRCPHRSYDCPLRTADRCRWSGRYTLYNVQGGGLCANET